MEAIYFGCNDLAPLSNGSMPECTTGPYVYSLTTKFVIFKYKIHRFCLGNDAPH